MTRRRDRLSSSARLTGIKHSMPHRHDLLTLAGLCLCAALMVGVALLAGWAAQAEAPAASAPAAARP